MSIDEAIRHCLKVADGQTAQGKCPECAEDHRQLAQWLTDYKRLKERESCDAISRQAVMDTLCNECELFHRNGEQICSAKCEEYHFLATLPSVNPQRTGHWVGIDEEPHEDYECDNCGFIHTFIDGHTAQYNYCPNCGAKMQGGAE